MTRSSDLPTLCGNLEDKQMFLLVRFLFAGSPTRSTIAYGRDAALGHSCVGDKAIREGSSFLSNMRYLDQVFR